MPKKTKHPILDKIAKEPTPEESAAFDKALEEAGEKCFADIEKQAKDRAEFPTLDKIMTSQPMTENNSPLKFEVEVISVEAAAKLALEYLSQLVYGRILTANQYGLVLDLMREYTYQNQYQPPATCAERLKRINASIYQPYF